MTLAALKSEFSPARQQTRFLGISPESIEVRKQVRNATLHLDEAVTSQTMIAQKRHAIAELIQTVRQSARPNWDGYGADPVKPEGFMEAVRLLGQLPVGLPNPEFEVLANGDIALEWHLRKGHSFIISLSGESLISYAGLLGPGAKVHGTEYFFEEIPYPVVQSLLRLFP